MGRVRIYDGDTMDLLWEGHNSPTKAMAQRVVQSFRARGDLPPLYIAVGAGYRPYGDTLEPWDYTQLVSEMARFRVRGSFVDPLSGKAALITVFRAQNINTEWKELGLFDSPELADYGNRKVTSCDSLNVGLTNEEWIGTGTSLLVDPGAAVEGSAAIVASAMTPASSGICDVGGGAGEKEAGKVGLTGYGMDSPRLQFSMSVRSITSFSYYPGAGVGLIAFTTSSDRYSFPPGAYWTEPGGGGVELNLGENYIDVAVNSDAVQAGAPTKRINSLGFGKLSLGGGTTAQIAIDRIRLFQPSGTLLSRVEIKPSIRKAKGSTRVIEWMFEPLLGI